MTDRHFIHGFVLKQRQLLNQDLHVVMFTNELGKISCIAKGARAFHSRRIAHLQTGNLISLWSREYHGARYLDTTQLVSGFTQVKMMSKMELMYLFFFILDRLTPFDQEESLIFQSILSFMTNLSRVPQEAARIFEQSVADCMRILGYTDTKEDIHTMLSRIETLIDERLPRHGII